MENKIYNKYGAVRYDTPEAREMAELSNAIDRLIHDYFRAFPDLTPVEVRCVNAYLNLNAVCCQNVLQKATALKKIEKDANLD